MSHASSSSTRTVTYVGSRAASRPAITGESEKPMFNLLADVFQAGGIVPRTAVLEVHPAQLGRWLEELWGAGPANIPVPAPLPPAQPFLGNPGGIVQALDIPPAGNVSLAGPSGISPANP